MIHGKGFHNRRSPARAIGALSASTITRTTGATTYPPQVSFSRPIDWIDGNKATMQWSTDPLFGSGVTQGNTVTLASGTSSYNFGLSAIVSGSYFMRLGAWSGASQPSNAAMNWSNIQNVGDTTAPTISTSTSQSGSQGVAGSITLTASEPISSWAITGGTDAASFTLTPQTSTTASLAYGAFGTAGTRSVNVTATDYAGNTSATWTGSVNIIGPTAFDASFTGSFLNLLSSNTQIQNQLVNNGVPDLSLATNAIPSGKFYGEFKVHASNAAGGQYFIGLGSHSTTLHSATQKINPGIALRSDGFIWINNVNYATGIYASALPDWSAPGTVVQFCGDTNNNLIWFGSGGTFTGDPVAGTNGIPFTFAGSTWYACGGINVTNARQDILIEQLVAANMTFAPPTGFTAYS